MLLSAGLLEGSANNENQFWPSSSYIISSIVLYFMKPTESTPHKQAGGMLWLSLEVDGVVTSH
jgi:hypothetical protein